MLAAYRAVYRKPGTAAFSAAGFVMRFPLGMYPLGLVLIVSARTGHYEFAGILTGTDALANAVGTPVLARVSDRFGQGRVLIPVSAVHVAAAIVLAAGFIAGWPDWSLLAATVVTGFTFLPIGSLVLARWSYILAGAAELGTAYAAESIFDDVIYVLGPLVATLLATHFDPVVVLFAAAALIGVGAVWLTALRGSIPPPPGPAAPSQRSALREQGMPLVAASATAIGAIFGSSEVAMVAYCGQHGQRALSGAVLAAFAAGSMIAGIAYGARRWRRPVLDRFRLQALLFGALPVLFLAAWNVGTLAAFAFVVGIGIAPTLITAYGLVEEVVPARTLTEGLAWVLSGISLGYAGGAALVGGIADAHGARVAFGVTVGAGVLLAGFAVILHARLRPTASPPVALA